MVQNVLLSWRLLLVGHNNEQWTFFPLGVVGGNHSGLTNPQNAARDVLDLERADPLAPGFCNKRARSACGVVPPCSRRHAVAINAPPHRHAQPADNHAGAKR